MEHKKVIGRNTTVSSFLWRLLERVGAQGVQFVVSIILGRMLAPELFGTITLVSVFTTILSVFVESGFANALIQKKDADDLDFSSVFYFNAFLCVALYLVMFFAAPAIAQFYSDEQLIAPIRVISLTIIVGGVKNVQTAYVSRTMQFRRFFYATLGGTLGAATIGVWMAYRGYGIWALVSQYLFNNTIDTIILWVTVNWRPKLMFSFQRLKALFSYGWKLLLSTLINTSYGQLRQLIIGKVYSPASLAFYDRGNSFPFAIVNNVNASINSVLFPVMSVAQDDVSTVKSIMRRAVTTSCYVMWPMMLGLAACAEPFVKLFLTEKWLPCVPFLRLFCVSYALYPIHSANLNVFKAMGRSDLFLRVEVLKKALGLTIIVITMRYGVLAIAYGVLAVDIISVFINAWPSRSLIDYPFMEQAKDILPAILLSAAMSLLVWGITLFNLPSALTLVLQIATGIVVYVFESVVFKIDSFWYVLHTVKGLMTKK